jgi:hypothetical protein
LGINGGVRGKAAKAVVAFLRVHCAQISDSSIGYAYDRKMCPVITGNQRLERFAKELSKRRKKAPKGSTHSI